MPQKTYKNTIFYRKNGIFTLNNYEYSLYIPNFVRQLFETKTQTMRIKAILLFLALAILRGFFSCIMAQEPADLGNYQITKIGSTPVFNVTTDQWYLMGRNKYMVDNNQDEGPGYVWEESYETTDVTSLVSNAACTSTDGWTCTGSNTFHYDHWSTANGMTNNFLEYWVGQPATLSDATISHSQLTGLEQGCYQITVEATCCSEVNNNPVSGASFWATGTSTVSVNLNTEEAGAGTFTGWHGTYKLIVEVGAARTLDFGFTVKDATFNWLAFRNVTLTKLGAPFSAINVSNGDCSLGSAGTSTGDASLTNWRTTEYTLSRQEDNARFNLGDSWTGYAGDLYNNGSVFANKDTVSHDQITDLQNGKYQISVNARAAGNKVSELIVPTAVFRYNWQFPLNASGYEGAHPEIPTADIEAIKQAIGAPSINDVVVKFVDVNNVERNIAYGNWCKVDGTSTAWSGDGTSTECAYYVEDVDWAGTLDNKGRVFNIGRHPYRGTIAEEYNFRVSYTYNGATAYAFITLSYGVFNYVFESTAGRDHEGFSGDINETEILNAIGTASKSTVTVKALKGDGTYTDAVTYASPDRTVLLGGSDGWRDADANFTAWEGDASQFCVKFDPKITTSNATGQIDYVGGRGHSRTTDSYTATFVYTNTSNNYEALVNVTLKYKAEFNYQAETPVGSEAGVNYWQAAPIVVDIASIKTAIGSTANDDYTVYSEQLNGTRVEGVIKDATVNGWRNSYGDLYQYEGGAFYLQNPSGDFTNYVIGGNYNTCQTPVTYTTKLIYKHNTTGREAIVYMSLKYVGDVFFYANDERVSLSSGTKYEGADYEGYHGTYTMEVQVNNGTLDFGFDIAPGFWKWLSFKDVKLYYLGAQGLKVSDGLPASLATLQSNGTPVPATDVKRYLVRFTNDGWGTKGQWWQMQMGTGHYVLPPSGDGANAEIGTEAEGGKFYVYYVEGTRYDEVLQRDQWTIDKEAVLIKHTDGGGYLNYMFDNGVNNVVSFGTNPNSVDERWGVDINLSIPFSLYPVDVCETNPTTPTLTGPETSTTSAPVFYKIKSVGQNDYASYSSITASQYPQLVDFTVGGYAVMGRSSTDVSGNSYWWFSDAAGEGYQHQSGKGSKRVHIHNVMMHDVDYSYENHHDEALHSPIEGMVRMYRDANNTQPTDSCLYYLLPTTAAEQNGFAISRSEYSGTPNDSWYSAEQVVGEIGQHSTLAGERNYKVDANSLYTFETASVSEVWSAVVATKREDLHEGSYFSPSKETLDAIFNKTEYQVSNITAANFFERLKALSSELYAAATDPTLPTLAPEDGGRFYFKNYAVPNHYLAYGQDMDTEDTRLTITQADKPAAANVWEVIPFSDPTLIVRLDDQPKYNGFPSAYYETLPHKPLQRFWLRNRSTGHFVTHAPVDKSGLEKISDGVWRMYEGDTFIGGQQEVGTVNSLNRENADLWYLDVVTNPRTGVRTGVLRTLFCYDYGPWTGTSWDGSYAANGRAIGETGAAIAGYNYPVIQWSLSRHVNDNWNGTRPPAECIPPLYAWGVTDTDHTRAFSQWVIYDIDTDLPEVGVNYTLKNKYSGMYAYWNGNSTDGSLKQVESVESLSTTGDNNPNRGVWSLVDLATPVNDHWRIANRWAIETNQPNQKLNPLKLAYTVAENEGSTFYMPLSNVDSTGIAIGTSATLNFNSESWLRSYDNKTGVTQDKSEDDRAVWSIDKVDRLLDDVIYELNKMAANITTGDEIFYLKNNFSQTMLDYITHWENHEISLNNQHPTYVDILSLLKGEGNWNDDNFNMPADNTRYLIKNKETGRYLTNLGQLMTVDEADLSYFSIWSFARNKVDRKFRYTLTNEGAASVMNAQNGTHETGNQFVSYDNTAGTGCFQMGSSNENPILFRPDGAGFARFYSLGETDVNKVAYGPSEGNRVVQSKNVNISNAYWTVVPVESVITDEQALVQNTITNMAGYSGGPITVAADEIQPTTVTTGTGSYSLASLPGAISSATGSAADLGTLISNAWNLDEKFLLQWKPGYPVFLDNVFRPTKGARLTTGTETAWATTTTKDETEATQTFEFAGETNGSYTLVNQGSSKYLAASTADNENAAATDASASAAQLTVTEIVPSVYSVKDANNRYLSISDEGKVQWTAICGYGSLWRIKCNDYLQPRIAQVPAASDLWPSKFVNTFVTDYDTQMKVSDTDKVKVYYALDAKSAGEGAYSIGERTVEGKTVKQLQITFKEVPAEEGSYLLQGGQAYLIVKDPSAVADQDKTSSTLAHATNSEIKVWAKHKGTYEGGTLVGKNLLKTLDNAVEISSSNQRQFFELNYIAPGTNIGNIAGQAVYAFGIGFYPLKVGRTIPAKTQPVITSDMLGSWIGKLREAIGNDAGVKAEGTLPGIEIVLENQDGTATTLNDLLMPSDTSPDGPVYDLSGRKVADSLNRVNKNGLYIVNGQKVMKK